MRMRLRSNQKFSPFHFLTESLFGPSYFSCPGNCTCYHDQAWSANIVECSNSNYDQVPSRLPMDSTEIYLDGNNMSQLGSHIFIGKKNLRVLFLNDSKVEFIRNKTFNGLRSLEVLRLE